MQISRLCKLVNVRSPHMREEPLLMSDIDPFNKSRCTRMKWCNYLSVPCNGFHGNKIKGRLQSHLQNRWAVAWPEDLPPASPQSYPLSSKSWPPSGPSCLQSKFAVRDTYARWRVQGSTDVCDHNKSGEFGPQTDYEIYYHEYLGLRRFCRNSNFYSLS